MLGSVIDNNHIIMILNQTDSDKYREKAKIVVMHVMISLFARDLTVPSSRFYQAISRSRSRSPPGFTNTPRVQRQEFAMKWFHADCEDAV